MFAEGLFLLWSLASLVVMATDVASLGDAVFYNTDTDEAAGVRWAGGNHDVTDGLDTWEERRRQRLQRLRVMQRKFAAIEVLLSDQLGVMRRYLNVKYHSAYSTNNDHNDTLSDETDSWAPKTSSLYVRWGSTECPRTAMKIYDGVVGGAWSLKQGDEVDSQCLPNNPSFLTLESDVHSHEGDDIHKERLSGQNIPYLTHGTPCAVCRIGLRPTVNMLLGRSNCTSYDWTLEYTGAVMTCLGSHRNQDEYLCVDESSHTNDGSSDNTHIHESQTCAVCTK